MNLKRKAALYSSTFLMIATSAALVGCKSDKKASIPGDAQGRIEGMASVLPQSTEAAIFVGDIGKMRKTMLAIKDTVGEAVPQLEATQKQVEAEIGFNPLDAKAWETAGLSDSTGFTVAFVNNRLAMIAYVNDRQKFDTFVTEKAKKATGATAAPTSEDVGGKQVKIITEGDKTIAWVHEGKLAILATSVMEKEMGGDMDDAKTFVTKLAALKSDASASATPQFKQFDKAFDDSYGIVGYANAKNIIAHKGYKDGRAELVSDPMAKPSVEWFEQHGEVMGFGAGMDGNEMEVSFFFGADEATNKQLAEVAKTDAKMPWTGFATEEVLLGFRTSVNMDKFWPLYMKNLPEAQATEVKNALAKAGTDLGVDIEKDVVGNMTGNIALFFYGINIGAAMGAAQNPMAAARALNLAVGIQVKDGKKLEDVVTKLSAKAGPDMSPQALMIDGKAIDGAKIIKLPDDSIKVIMKDDLLIIGTKELSDKAAYSYMTGKGDTAKLTDKGGVLGKAFGSDKPYNGLYINVEKLETIVSAFAAGSAPAKVLKKLDEASLSSENTDNGVFMHLRVTTKGQ